jgi:outer membrane protein
VSYLEEIVSRLLKFALAMLACSVPVLGWAEGKIAVFDLQSAILQTDAAQARLKEVRSQDEYKKNKAEFDKIKSEGEALVKSYQKDAAVMSDEQKAAAEQKINSMQEDLEHVAGKLQQAEQTAAQALFQEMGPKVQEALREIIEKDGIGLLLQRQAVIHAEPGYSITAKVTDKLNQLNTK